MVLPAPGGACKTSTPLSAVRAVISSSTSSMGSETLVVGGMTVGALVPAAMPRSTTNFARVEIRDEQTCARGQYRDTSRRESARSAAGFQAGIARSLVACCYACGSAHPLPDGCRSASSHLAIAFVASTIYSRRIAQQIDTHSNSITKNGSAGVVLLSTVTEDIRLISTAAMRAGAGTLPDDRVKIASWFKDMDQAITTYRQTEDYPG